MLRITEKDGAVTFAVRVIPRASRSEIVGEMDGAVKVRLASPPVDGAANEELIKLFAKALRVAKSRVELASGQTSRSKQLRISGVSSAELQKLISG